MLTKELQYEQHREFASLIQLVDFSTALDDMKTIGFRMARTSWIDPFAVNIQMAYPFVVVMTALELPSFNTQGTERKVNDRTAQYIGENTPLHSQPYFSHYTPRTNAWQPGWVPQTVDIFADDWFHINRPKTDKETARMSKMMEVAAKYAKA